MPARRDFDVPELQSWLGHISLTDVLSGGKDFRYRLHGTWNVETLGMDLTGRRVSDLPADMQKIVRRDHLRIQRLSMPLAADGEEIDMLMSCIYLVE